MSNKELLKMARENNTCHRNEDLLFDYGEIRSRNNVVEYAIYSYFKDGSFDDVQNTVIMNRDEDIEQYIRDNYGMLLSDYENK